MIDLPFDTLYAGAPAPLGATGAVSAIVKTPAPPPWRIAAEGLVGDAQANRRHHGGAEKALHHYPREHYAAWIAEDASLAATLGETLAAPAAFGENIATLGATEQTVCVGDVFTLGAARLQVSQGRQPCLTLNLRFGRRDMAARVQETGRTGWYYRVLEAGEARPGDRLRLVERAQPDWPLARLTALLYERTRAFDELAAMAELPELAESWRSLARKRVETRKVESWAQRLGTSPRAP